jgi:tagaturonate reductase
MNLSQSLVINGQIQAKNNLIIPNTEVFNYPEKVLQFGTGVLLRGLPDYFINKANQGGVFQGRILVVKSTQGSATEFDEQDGLYTITVRGLEKGVIVERHIINSAISRVVSANDHWQEILQSALNPAIQIVISNTTEVGIQYVEESIYQNPPQSFPAKLTAWLHERYKNLANQSPDTVIIPTELIPDNGKKLLEIVMLIAHFNELGTGFLTWLAQKVIFCNSLVDRIVTGMPEPDTAQKIYQELGYEDKLLTVTEPYKLWAIEGSEKVKSILKFAQTDLNVIIEPDITYYRERKLRILNGSHTISVCKGFLNHLNTVLECMQDTEMSAFFTEVIFDEIAPTIPHSDTEKVRLFAQEILDRYRNPYLVHWLLNITLQSTSKMKMRNIPTLFRYFEKYGKIPEKIAEGFAYYLYFMRSTSQEGDKYFGTRQGERYPINDDSAAYFAQMWQKVNPQSPETLAEFVKNICQNISLWGENLYELNGFAQAIYQHLRKIINQ